MNQTQPTLPNQPKEATVNANPVATREPSSAPMQEVTLVNPSLAKWKKYANYATSIALILYGLKGLVQEVINLFYVYPNIPQQFAESGYDVSVFFRVYNQFFFTTLAGFLSASYGLAMLVKSGRRIKIVNYILTLLIFLFTYLANNNFQLPFLHITLLPLNF